MGLFQQQQKRNFKCRMLKVKETRFLLKTIRIIIIMGIIWCIKGMRKIRRVLIIKLPKLME